MRNIHAAIPPFDFAPIHRSMIGFDQVNDMVHSLMSGKSGETETRSGYPPHNIEKIEDDKYRISFAVAGFAEENLSVEIEDKMLVVTGKVAPESQERNYLHRGIANRAFRKKFNLDDHIHVTGASYENGMLSIDLEREMPEVKPHQIEINSANGRTEANEDAIAA